MVIVHWSQGENSENVTSGRVEYKENRPVGRVVTRSSLEREVRLKRFKSQAGEIGRSIANGSMLATARTAQHFFERSCVARTQRLTLKIYYTLRRNTATIVIFDFDKENH